MNFIKQIWRIRSGRVVICSWIFSLVICVIALIIYYIRKRKIDKKISSLSNSSLEITPKEFFELRSFKQGRNRSYLSNKNFTGIYILYNKTKDMYYVGQATQVFNRINSHFTGRGNGDVYADYKYGDEFTIKTIPLSDSGFSSLNELEKYTIARYDAYKKGYNRTRGNRN